jgi:LAO/AO transport system kinase
MIGSVADKNVDLLAGLTAQRPRDIARAITLIENDSDDGRKLLAELIGQNSGAARAAVVGLTGAPGVGKSTTTSALVHEFRRRGLRVAVLAIDPSSPFSGGALLGDRIRMQEHSADPDVYIRSMASRGHLGGLAAATGRVLRVLDAAGFNLVLVETVGVGQSEVEIAATADTTVVLIAPGMGDAVQAAKAGLLEIGDVYAVNKADRDGADSAERELRSMIGLGMRDASDWTPLVVRTVASTAMGIPDLVDAIDAHQQWLDVTGALAHRRLTRARAEILHIAVDRIEREMQQGTRGKALDLLAAKVADGKLDPHQAVEQLLSDSYGA